MLLCFGFGLCLMLYPWVREEYFEQQKQLVYEQWLDTQTQSKAAGRTEPLVTSDGFTTETAPVAAVEYAEGILSIPAIELKTPILSTINEYNLNLAICRVTGPTAGEYGNYCLAGHKSRTYGRHFNRLHEVNTGDLIMIETADEEYIYRITGSFTVAAEDGWVLADDHSKKQITLITCDYSTQPVGRLIVHGELNEEGS